ncbi:hypothetical protein GF312_03970 [Candidatus Poribacteria bacterium]|nr:hypothetical protein [Candidatus Poribacteria bacterium]
MTGNPTPDVEFSKDDSNGAWGEYIAQINLEDPSDTYNLTATATNAEGSDSASINLDWQCAIPNNPPVLGEISVDITTPVIFDLHTYSINIAADDPDGDSLEYSWTCTAGSLDDGNAIKPEWSTPGTGGDYQISVIVDDGNGGIAESSKTVSVYNGAAHRPLYNEGGFITRNEAAHPGSYPCVGDSDTNQPERGYISFDIEGFSGSEKIGYAEIWLIDEVNYGTDPESLIDAVWVSSVYWGGQQIELNDYDLSGALLGEFPGVSNEIIVENITDKLKQAIDDGRDRFQIQIRHKGYYTDNDNCSDGWRYEDAALVFYSK